MSEPIENRNLTELRPLAPPRAVKERLPLTEGVAGLVLATRRAIRDVIHGRDPKRLVVVVGPCSIHHREATLDYAARLKRVADLTREHLVVVMRTYVEKPRTTVGWKGLINDPQLDGSCDIAGGIELARRILLEINELGLPCASELLDPVTPQYLADLLSWFAVGARTCESQIHRELASGLSMPVGFKNATDGGLEVARNAMISARHAHSFVGIDAEGRAAIVRSRGNPDRHVVLRGGAGGPNFDAAAVARAADLVAEEGIARPIMVDCSHDNSGRDPARQAGVWRDVVGQFLAGQRRIMGLMAEGHLEGGRQAWSPGAPLSYGVSITDACMGWPQTEALLMETAEALATA